MARFVGHHHGEIFTVSRSEHAPDSKDLTFTQVPESLRWALSRSLVKNYEVVRGQVLRKDRKKNPMQMRVAFVGVYKIPCGISTYSEWLWEKMIPHFSEYKIFAENGSGSKGDDVVQCWTRGRPLTDLARQLIEYEPDAIYIQHEFGLFPNARHWLSFLSLIGHIPTFVTFHSTYEHKDKTILEAAVPNIIVHTDEARHCLLRKGVTSNIYVIPHGSHLPERQDRLWDIYRSRKTIVQFGFGFRYKGWDQALLTVAALKPKHPEIFFTGLFSETPHAKAEMDLHFVELQRMVERLHIEENVALIRGYQSEDSLESFLRTNNIAIFPYFSPQAHRVYACSGAARIAMKYGIPCIVSKMNHFDDLREVCPRAGSPEEAAAFVEGFFDTVSAAEQVKRQNNFLINTQWARVACQYVDLVK